MAGAGSAGSGGNDEVDSSPLENEQLLDFPDMLIRTGLNATFDRMPHMTASVKTKNPKAIVIDGGPANYRLERNTFFHNL